MRIFLLNQNRGLIVHSILVLQLRWHLGEQLFSHQLLPRRLRLWCKWADWNPSTVPNLIFTGCQTDEPWHRVQWEGRRKEVRRTRTQKKLPAAPWFSSPPHWVLHLAFQSWVRISYRSRAGLLQGRHTWTIGFMVNTKCNNASIPPRGKTTH